MSEENPNIEELKAEEKKVTITIEEDDVAGAGAKAKPESDVSDALRDLGRQFAETLRTAWDSQERREFEREVKEGVEHFAAEVNRAFKEAKESPAAQKVKEETEEFKTQVERGEFSHKARSGLVEGLQWLSEELGRLAQQFSPPEKQPGDVEVEVEVTTEEKVG